MSQTPIRVFLSHAAADKPLVEASESLLSKSLGVLSAEIFCSSLEGQGVKKGKGFVEEIRDNVLEAKAVVALITPAYLDSPFCMAELGAAWALNSHRLPIVVPPNTFKVMDATLLGIVGVMLDDELALAQAFEELGRAVGLEAPTSGVRGRALRDFMRTWPNLKEDLRGPQRIDAALHEAAIRERDQAIADRDDAEEALTKAEAHVKALETVKDAREVARIGKQFDDSNWEQDLDKAIDSIRELYSDLGGREIVRLLILDHLGKFIRPDSLNFGDEVDRAVELDVYDPEGIRWNYSHPDVQTLGALVDNIKHIFALNPKAVDILRARGEKYDPNNIRFWETRL